MAGGVATLMGVALAGTPCADTLVFHADFERAIVGRPPSDAPPDPPSGDRIYAEGAPGTVYVTQSSQLGSRALAVDRGTSSLATVVDFVGDQAAASSATRYRVRFRIAVLSDESTLSISIRSPGGARLAQIGIGAGRATLTGGSGAVGRHGFTRGRAYAIELELDGSHQRFTARVDGQVVAEDAPFVNPGVSRVGLMRLEYAPAIVEARPGEVVVDDVEIRSVPAGGPCGP